MNLREKDRGETKFQDKLGDWVKRINVPLPKQLKLQWITAWWRLWYVCVCGLYSAHSTLAANKPAAIAFWINSQGQDLKMQIFVVCHRTVRKELYLPIDIGLFQVTTFNVAEIFTRRMKG
jgi:hypothetical protein